MVLDSNPARARFGKTNNTSDETNGVNSAVSWYKETA